MWTDFLFHSCDFTQWLNFSHHFHTRIFFLLLFCFHKYFADDVLPWEDLKDFLLADAISSFSLLFSSTHSSMTPLTKIFFLFYFQIFLLVTNKVRFEKYSTYFSHFKSVCFEHLRWNLTTDTSLPWHTNCVDIFFLLLFLLFFHQLMLLVITRQLSRVHFE